METFNLSKQKSGERNLSWLGVGLRVSTDIDQAARRPVGEAAGGVLPLAARRKMTDKVEVPASSKKAT